MMIPRHYRKFFFGIWVMLPGIYLQAQDTTNKHRTVEVTSTFKPVLHQTAKINMNATPPAEDTTKPKLQYSIPDENLLFDYQPGNLKPLAMNIDTGGRWDNNSYIKAGFGSQRTPYLQTGISFGDGKTAGMNIYAKHVASNGKKDFQDFSHTDIGFNGFFQTSKNLEWDAKLGLKSDQTYKYGYQPDSLFFPTDSLKQRFQTLIGRVAFHNIQPTSFGLSYSPEIRIHVFSDNHNNNESNTYVNLPLEKTIGQDFAVDLGLTFDLTRYKPGITKVAVNNTAYYISPAVVYHTPTINIHAGIQPTWDNKSPKIYPDVTAEIGTPDKRFNFIAGWIGYLRKTTYEYLASFNPWIWAPLTMKNTGIEERYVGFKGSIDDHFSYSTKAGFNKLTNQPLFVNDTADGKSFIVLNESQMKVLHYDAEIGYTQQEKFSFRAGFSLNHYMNLKDNPKAYGLLPAELNASLRVQVLKDLYLTSDLFGWGGAQYRKQDGDHAQQKGAFDLNAGLDFQVTKNLKVWTQFNNIFNQEYQRWNQYPVYGFNFVAGVIFAFDQKN